MELTYGNLILRDYRLSDIEDEIRWMTEETAWMQADTPWESAEPCAPQELREQMMQMVENMPENAVRWRLEIETEGRHIGFVSSYLLNENYTPADWNTVDWKQSIPENHLIRALGIEICEPAYWCNGLGTQALTAFMDYYKNLGETRFALETWSGNLRMLGCARKLGFTEVRRETGVRAVGGNLFDSLILEYWEHEK